MRESGVYPVNSVYDAMTFLVAVFGKEEVLAASTGLILSNIALAETEEQQEQGIADLVTTIRERLQHIRSVGGLENAARLQREAAAEAAAATKQ